MNCCRVLLSASLLIGTTLPACRFFSVAEQQAEEEKKTLFDHLIALAPGKKVPYPFEKLLSYLAQYARPTALLVPLGKSQLRHDSAEPFRDPRRIVTFLSPEYQDMYEQNYTLYLNLFKQLGLPMAKGGGYTIADRLYLAYTEKSEQIEVTSLLPGGVEFDYQVVKNYRAGGNQHLVAADRKHCRSCHQQDLPLTPALEAYGGDSNSPIIRRLIARHHPDGVLDGIPFVRTEREEEHNREEKTLLFSYFINSQGATRILTVNRVWQDGCVQPRDRMVCRKLILQKLIGDYFGIFSPMNYTLPKKLKMKPPAFFKDYKIRNPYPEYYRPSNEMLQGFALSAAGKRVLTKIKSTKLGDLTTSDDEGLADIINVFTTAGGMDIDFSQYGISVIPTLNAADLSVVDDEVEKLLIHIHRKDLHINTPHDPAYDINKKTDRFGAPLLSHFHEEKKALLQRIRLPANKVYQEVELYNNPGLDGAIVAKKAIIERSSLFKLPRHIDMRKAREGENATCQTTATITSCEFKAVTLNDKFCERNCKTATLDFNLHLKHDPQVKPPVSPLALQLDGKHYRFEFLCFYFADADKEQRGKYTCTERDSWKLEKAFAQFVADPSGAFHYPYFDFKAIIRDLLQKLDKVTD